MLRPVLFKIISTTQLKIGFNYPVSETVGIDNFKIEAISGSDADVEILSVQIDGQSIVLNTRPHYAKGYYVLKLLDSSASFFISTKGLALINDDLSRDIYFIGIDKVNQIRDDLFFKTPAIYNIDNTLVSSLLGTTSDYLLGAQHAIGSLLNDNYISQSVDNEYRARSAGATDRLSNENAYEITRVSSLPSNSSVLNRVIEIDSTDIYPINLRQELIEGFSISSSTSNASFKGYIVSVPNKNIIKVVSAKLIKASDTQDCDGNIGTIYDLQKYKYGLYDNRYDQKNSLSNKNLESNQIAFSDFSNWDRPSNGDTIVLSYYYDNASIFVISSTIEVYEATNIYNESIPSNSKNFSLRNPLIINSSDEQPDVGGVTFKESENSTATPSQFSDELIYNFSSLPRKIGEYSINYETGDVYVVGDSIGEGTGYNYLFADYRYKKLLKNNLDFNVYGNELNLNYLRPVFTKNIKISFDYESVFAEDIDYKVMAHKEVLNEMVQNRVSSSFSLKTKNQPITDVFRIYNQTTGEVYPLNYFYGNEVFFTGNKLPSAKEIYGEPANFESKSGEELYASGIFISPLHYATITANASNLTIEFSPGLPSEFIDSLTTTYFIRFLDQNLDDYKISGFYSADSNGLITGFSINSGLTLPNTGTKVQIGVSSLIFDLPDNRITNSTGDGLGTITNSSVSVDPSIFKNEKFFKQISRNNEITPQSAGSQTYVISSDQLGILNENLSRIRRSGDYLVDYNNGVIYLGLNGESDLYGGQVGYSFSSTSTKNLNVISVNSAYKKLPISISSSQDVYPYSSVDFSESSISILDISQTIESYDGSSIINNYGETKDILIVDEEYNVTVSNKISSIRMIVELKDLVGKDLDSSVLPDRYLESSSEELTKSKLAGGKNLYIPQYVGFSGQVIDLKASNSSKVYTVGAKLEVTFRTPDVSSIYSIFDAGSNIILDQSHNFIVDAGIATTSIVNYSATEYQVFFDQVSSNYSFNAGYDYLWNGTDRWLITGFSTSGYFIINKLSEVYSINFSEEIFDLAIRPDVTIGDQTLISYPINNFISSGSIVKIKYVTTVSPQPGTAVAVEYSSGSIFFDYVAMNDELVVYYEYGDNEIDWSINNSIAEGQPYFVSYKYGALRSALVRNFGRLTAIPFFENQSLSVDRELYRDAVYGVLSAYPKGPTVPAISGLVQSIVKTTPDIKELQFGSWILGRDYLSPQKVSYEGDLEFVGGKFGSGLKIADGNAIWIPSISSLSIDEGTAEMWISPDWYGINNDASLTFSFDNVGDKKYFFIGGDPFSTKNGYDVVGSWDYTDERRGFDSTGGKLTIFKVVADDGYVSADYSAIFGIFKKNLNLNRETTISQKTEFNINYSYLSRDSASFSSLVDSGAYSAAAIVIDDLYNMANITVVGSTFKELGTTKIFNVGGLSADNISDFGPPYPTAMCSCFVVNQVTTLSNFNVLEIKITLEDSVLKSELFSESFWENETCKTLMIVDNLGRFYDVTALSGLDGKRTDKVIPDYISEIYVSRYPTNYPDLTSKGFEELNDIDFSQFIIVKKQIKLNLKEEEKSSLFFGENYTWNFDWSRKTKIDISIDQLSNSSTIKSSSQSHSFFYTDLLSSDILTATGANTSEASTCIGVFGMSSMNVFKNLIETGFKFKVGDIFIGENGVHPTSTQFTLNRLNTDIDVSGISPKFDSTDGIYIGYDGNCLSPINENVGQWLLRARFLKYSQLPYDVEILGDGLFQNLTEYIFIDNPITGSVKTNGTFSSITKGRRTISAACEDTKTCSKNFRFLGNKLLDSDGWSLLQESDSEIIDVLNSGREVESYSWRKIGEFDTQNSSGIYRIDNLSGFDSAEDYFLGSSGLTVLNSCTEGNIEISVSAKIVYFDEATSALSVDTVALSSGIVIAEINSGDYDLGISLDSDSSGNGLISLVNLATLEKLGTESFDWKDSLFHKYSILIDKENSIVTVYIDDSTVIQKDLALIETSSSDGCIYNTNPGFSIMIVDQRLIATEEYLSTISPPIIDFNFIESNSNYNPGFIKLEDSDIFIVSDNLATFELHPNPNETDEVVIDGYISESDVDEIMITSDVERFLMDSGISETQSRFSLFKDGKGFLNFRIIDSNKKNPSIYNIATNIKNFMPGERHHIAVSWKLNSSYERDEMHLFIDGQEVPSLFKFGGYAPIKFNSKFSDISRENLYNYIEKKVIFPAIISDGSVAIGSNVLNSATLTTDDTYVGRSIIFGDTSGLYGKLVVILEVGAGWVAVGDPITLEPYLFESSESGISFSLAPYSDSIYTDINNERFSIFRRSCDGIEEELGGLGYSVEGGSIIISNYPENTSYRYNKTYGIIEFVKRDPDSCLYAQSVDRTDISIDIRTFGLNGRRYRDVIGLSGTSLFLDEGADPPTVPNSRDGYSIISSSGPRPKNLSDVIIRKYSLYNKSIDASTIYFDGTDYISSFEESLLDSFTSLQTINIAKNNDGRYFEIQIDSDNIYYGATNTIVVHGTTPSGPSTETIVINKNGSFFTQDRYLELEKITGDLNIIDGDYDFVAIINVIEKNSIFVQDGSGDYAEIYRFSNGSFILSIAEETTYSAFELPPGYYLVDYSCSLKVGLSQTGERLYIGNDITKSKPLAGSIDDFVILNTMLSDLRSWEPSVSGVRTITEDFYRSNPQCISNSTLALIDFENPIEKQSRRLRNKKFLDTANNFSYNLTLNDREILLKYINNEEEFVNYMVFIGYSIQTAEELFFECSKAELGPLYNLATYLPTIGTYPLSPNSVNSSFGQSGRFENSSAVVLNNNNNILRNTAGTVEFWYQPKLDTFNDGDVRTMFESSSILVDRFTSTTPYLIKLNSPASEIVSIKLLSSEKLSNSSYYTSSEKTDIIFNEISIVEATGRYSKGSGTDKDFSSGCRLSLDGMDVMLIDALPGAKVDVLVTYVPRQYSGEKISIYKDPYSRIIARIETKDLAYMIPVDVSWVEETWHRVCLSYNFFGPNKFIKFFIDGVLYNTVYSYGKDEYPETFDSSNVIGSINISLVEEMSQIIIGNRLDLKSSATGLIDNIRISRSTRTYPKDSSGVEFDLNYSSNISQISPVKLDDLTTYMEDFNFDDIERTINTATVIDPKYGIFDFEVTIGDDFNRVVGINGGKIEDLIVDLISRIKPAHSNAYVKFVDKKCKE